MFHFLTFRNSFIALKPFLVVKKYSYSLDPFHFTYFKTFPTLLFSLSFFFSLSIQYQFRSSCSFFPFCFAFHQFSSVSFFFYFYFSKCSAFISVFSFSLFFCFFTPTVVLFSILFHLPFIFFLSVYLFVYPSFHPYLNNCFPFSFLMVASTDSQTCSRQLSSSH